MENYGTAHRTLSSQFKPTSENFCHAWLCACRHSHVTDGWVCVVATHNYAGSKQTSFRIMIMEILVILDKAKHST